MLEIAPAEAELPLAGPRSVAEVQAAFRDPQTEAQRLHRLFCLPSAYVPQLPELRDYGLESFHPQRDVVAATQELMERIYDDFHYDPTATEVATPLREVFEGRRGVCQDCAHCALGVLRALGLPAAYCSGYLETDPPRGAKSWWGLMRPMPGSPCTCLSRAGWNSTQRTGDGRRNVMCFWGRAGITAMQRRSGALCRGEAITRFR